MTRSVHAWFFHCAQTKTKTGIHAGCSFGLHICILAYEDTLHLNEDQLIRMRLLDHEEVSGVITFLS